MSRLDVAVESTGAKFITRFVMPPLLTFAVGVGTWYATRIESLYDTVIEIRLEQRETTVRLSEVERRLNGSHSPITYLRSIYGDLR